MISGAGGDQGLFFTVGLRAGDNTDAISRVKKDADEINKHLENGAKKSAQTQMDLAQKRFDDEITRLIAREQIAKKQAEQDIRNAEAVAQAQIKAQREAETAQNRAAQEAETAHRRMEVSNKKLERAIDGVRGGVEQVARGFVLLGAAGEEDLEKLIKRFAAVEGGIQIFEGVLRIVRKGEEAWRAYTAAVAAARAAEGARATAGVAAAASGGAAVLAEGGVMGAGAALFGSPLAALAASAIAAAAALKILTDAASGDPTSMTARAGRSLGRTFADIEGKDAGGWYLGPYADERRTERGATAAERRLRDAQLAQEAEMGRRQIQSAFASEQAMFSARQSAMNAGAGLSGGRLAMALADQNIVSARGRFSAAESELNRVKGGDIQPNENISQTTIDAYQRMKAAADEIARSEKERADAIRQVNQESITTEREKLGLYREQLGTVKSQLDAAKSQFQSEAERFATLDPAKAQATVEAAKKARAGQDLDQIEAELLRGFSEFNQQVAEAGIRKAKELGGDFILAPLQAQINELSNRKKELESAVETARKAIKDTEANGEKMLQETTAKLAKQFEDFTKKLADANQAAMNAALDEFARKQTQKQQQGARAPGGQ